MMIVLLVGYLSITLVLVPPIIGTGGRYRAHYNPRGQQLDSGSEGEEQPHPGSLISSFFGMLRRILRIEVDT